MLGITLFSLGLAAGGLVMVSLSAKAVAIVLIEPVPQSRRIMTLAFAFLALLIGAGTAGVVLAILLPDSWNSLGYRVLFISVIGASIGLPVWWINVKHRRAQLNPPAAHVPPTVIMPAAVSAGNDQRQVWPHPHLAAALAAVRAQRLRHAKTLALILLAGALLIIGAAPHNLGLGGACIVLAVTAFVAINGFLRLDGVCGAEYRTLPGSTDASGKHRCVYCGHRGVYRSGQYKTSSTWHECTGCRKHLFVD